MHQKIEVVYENGVFRPVGPLPEPLRDRQRLIVTVEAPGLTGRPDAIGPAAATLEEVRAILAKSSRPLAEVVGAERDER